MKYFFIMQYFVDRAPTNDLELVKSLRELRGQNEFSRVAEKVLEVLDRHTDYLRYLKFIRKLSKIQLSVPNWCLWPWQTSPCRVRRGRI